MAAPVLTSLNPTTIDISSGTVVPVTIIGTGFAVDSVITADGFDAPGGQYVSDTEMTADLNTYVASGAMTLQIGARNDVDASNELPLDLTGTAPIDNPAVIPDTPPTGASPNTEAERADYLPPDPPDVYRRVADPGANINRSV